MAWGRVDLLEPFGSRRRASSPLPRLVYALNHGLGVQLLVPSNKAFIFSPALPLGSCSKTLALSLRLTLTSHVFLQIPYPHRLKSKHPLKEKLYL